MNITIRKASKLDVDAIVRLINDGGPEGRPRKILPDTLPSGYYEAFERISSDPKHHLMVAEYESEVVGCFQMTFLTHLECAGQDDCQVEAVHVSPKFRNQGIGSMMMKWVIEQAKQRNCRRVQLTSNKLRKDAHRFYQHLGFVLSHEGAKLPL